MGAKPKAQTVGFRYYFDIHFALGKKVDEVCAIRASGKTAWKGSITSNGQVRINAPELFGGDKGEGGLDGTLDVLFGEEDQGVLPRLAAMLGGLVLGVAEAQFSGMVNTDYKDVFAFSLLVLILIFRPQGLLGRPQIAKV